MLIYQRILFTYTKRAKEINTSGRLRGVKNNLSNETRPDPLFSTGTYTASDKRPVEKIVVWPRETTFAAAVTAKHCDNVAIISSNNSLIYFSFVFH